jgi:hypothetical protein
LSKAERGNGLYAWVGELWRANWWLYAIALLIFISGATVAASRIYYSRRGSDEPAFVGLLSDVTVLAFMVYIFLVFTRVVTGFYH